LTYCGTLLPPGIDLARTDESGEMHFDRPDRNRRVKAGNCRAEARHVRSRAQVEPPRYPSQAITEALAACRIQTRFRALIAMAPFITRCQDCGRLVEVAPPTASR
jgi:hypothetical protein